MDAPVSGAAIIAAAGSGVSAIAYKHDDLTYDLGLLTAFDTHPIDPAALASDKEATLLRTTQENMQLMAKHIFDLPIEKTDVGVVAVLPEKTTKLPRAKPIPRPKPLTRWEKFAKAKGIVKKKKDRLTFDEATGEHLPRYGYGKRKRDDDKDWLIEAKPGDDPTVDLFEQRDLKKKQRVIRNEISHVSNLQRASKAAEARTGASSSSSALASSIIAGQAPDVMAASKKVPGKKFSKKQRDKFKAAQGAGAAGAGGIDASRVPAGIAPIRQSEGRADGLTDSGRQARPAPDRVTITGAKEGKDIKKERLKHAQVSTASMGRFDRQLAGEPARPKDPRKQKRTANEVPAGKEKERQSDILKKVLHGSGEGEAARGSSAPSGSVAFAPGTSRGGDRSGSSGGHGGHGGGDRRGPKGGKGRGGDRGGKPHHGGGGKSGGKDMRKGGKGR